MEEYFIDESVLLSEVGLWSKRKYKLIELYSSMFTTSMKNKWDCRTYIDLFCGCGHSRIKKSSRITSTSPILALETNIKFDKYIFCDIDKTKLDILKNYIKINYKMLNVEYIWGDVNIKTDVIIDLIPQPSKSFKVISFCVVDPYKISNLKFSTIESIATKRFVDFFILIPSYMDANRNIKYYLENDFIDNFLGTTSWRIDWENIKDNKKSFGLFLIEQFNNKMNKLGFLKLNPQEFVKISEPTRNCPLYHLAFYSKSKLGKHFWNEAIKGSDPQLKLL